MVAHVVNYRLRQGCSEYFFQFVLLNIGFEL